MHHSHALIKHLIYLLWDIIHYNPMARKSTTDKILSATVTNSKSETWKYEEMTYIHLMNVDLSAYRRYTLHILTFCTALFSVQHLCVF